jgi:hypothetical protein
VLEAVLSREIRNREVWNNTLVEFDDRKVFYQEIVGEEVTLLMGTIFNIELTDHRDFVLKLIDCDLKTARSIVHNLRFAADTD